MNWYWPGFCRTLFFFFFPPPGAVEYAIDYTTDRGGSRCLRLIPIPRNRRSTSHVRFNIFDRYFVPRLFPLPSCVAVHTGSNYHPCVAGYEFSTVDQGAFCFRGGFRNRRLERFIFRCLSSRKKMDRFETQNVGESICERWWRCMEIRRGRGRNFSRSVLSNF